MIAAIEVPTAGGVVLWLVNLALAAVAAIVAFALRREIRRNDADHQAIRQAQREERDAERQDRRERAAAVDARIERLFGLIETESRNRHAAWGEMNRAVADVDGRMREDYQKRQEGMRLYGALMRKLTSHHRELMDRIDALPCRQAVCPSGSPEAPADGQPGEDER